MTKKKQEEKNKQAPNAYTLFLILILLILSENILIQLIKVNQNQIQKEVKDE